MRTTSDREVQVQRGAAVEHYSRSPAHFVLAGDLSKVPQGDLAVVSGHLREGVPEPFDAARQLHPLAVARGGQLLPRLQ